MWDAQLHKPYMGYQSPFLDDVISEAVNATGVNNPVSSNVKEFWDNKLRVGQFCCPWSQL
jgi:hypothetical protein